MLLFFLAVALHSCVYDWSAMICLTNELSLQEQERSLALPSIERQAIEAPPGGVQTWTYVPKNALMYVPEGKTVNLFYFSLCINIYIYLSTPDIVIYINTMRYDIWHDSVYVTCSKKLTGSQLSLPHGINKKLKCETKNKLMSSPIIMKALQ